VSRRVKGSIGIKVRFWASLFDSELELTRMTPEMFLPSYADYHFDDLERRQDPVEDIIVTEEEGKKMFPS
jgi:hypothetical protein